MSYLDQMLKQSPWLMDSSKIETDVHLARLASFQYIYYEKHFLDYDFQDGVYVVSGPRQIGKSTHLKMLIQRRITEDTKGNFFYFNCDLLEKKQDIVLLVEEYLEKFPSKTRRFVFLDEITSVKDSFIAIKFLIDAGYDQNVTYILTGSNTIGIKKTGEYLPGRRGKGIDFYFSPMSFKSFVKLQYPNFNQDLNLKTKESEFFALKQEIPFEKLLDDYLMTGGFPRVINEFYAHGKIGHDVFGIYRAWLRSEIAKSDKKEHIAKRVLERVLTRLSSEVSYNALAEDAGVGSHNTIYDYLDFFSNAYVLSLVFNFDIHQQRISYRKNKKIYFNDPFIFSVVEAWLSAKPEQDYDYLKSPELKSRLIENLVFIKLFHEFDAPHFYRAKKEVDFVADNYLFEVKYQNKIASRDYESIVQQNFQGFLISKNQFFDREGILCRPIDFFLLAEIA